MIQYQCDSRSVLVAKGRLTPIKVGESQRAGAVLDAELYNRLIDYAERMDVDMAWLIRHALRDFVERHQAQLEGNPRQLALDLTL